MLLCDRQVCTGVVIQPTATTGARQVLLWGKRDINILPDHICVLLRSPPALRGSYLPLPCHLGGLSQHPSPTLPMWSTKLSQHLAEMCIAPSDWPRWTPAA